MNTKLELTIKNTEQRCKLTDLDINVNITGFLSKTLVTMTFLNETDLDSEGEVNLKHLTFILASININIHIQLVFPMPEGMMNILFSNKLVLNYKCGLQERLSAGTLSI